MNGVSGTHTIRKADIYDLLGIGYGPAHLALSISLRESAEVAETHFKYHFLEQRSHFAWHPSLLLPGSQLQVSPLKDLVTLRDPTSTYSFYNYLHSHGRLARYINKEQGVPSRREWTSYLAWAARRMNEAVSYGQNVVSIDAFTIATGAEEGKQDSVALRPTGEEDALCLYRVRTRDDATGETVTRYARNISVAVGGVPRLPPAFDAAWAAQTSQKEVKRIVHSGFYLPSLQTLEPVLHETAACRGNENRLHLAVIGAGQSSTEMLMNLHARFPTAVVTMIFRASALVPSDDTGFINSAAFDPERTDEFWAANEAQRRRWLVEFKRTNYSVVRTDLLNELHDTMYDKYEVSLPEELQDPSEREAGRMEMRRCTDVDEVTLVQDGVELVLRDNLKNGRLETIKFDAVFVGTGFIRSPAKMPFLDGLKPFYPALEDGWTARDTLSAEAEVAASIDTEDEEVIERKRENLRGITRDYRLVPGVAMRTTPRSGKSSPGSETSSTSSQQTLATEGATKPEASLYVLGGNEATHGLSDSLLSIVAHRAGELTTSLLHRLPRSRRGVESEQRTEAHRTTGANEVGQKLAALSGLGVNA
ncbi:L-lysine 6-monooxygenase/L-ornithine 5-monooxygenase [Kalmanozyma brasiliensis GHG001]|uniref:L-ornithine N(5)-monooxygenase [NAD(P)H] n=1 Tax=Kalmanozyma brasiliensis (strain GHG001) TaxID=1365824 RepID=V5GRC6_KALBG|nr:L-lysine 6-monooxygenase/L-ornithine 5-monooxygenase [Kalmanozyma brasiliensis GHG001]EST08497.1 L-lysine 6-monooxygenase/L-ornithine 5-monooxygenase [Kalmanozyma brasiliensis GHG001]